MTNTLIFKNLKSVALYLISRIYGIMSILLRPFIKINNDAILFWSWNSRQYSCNPKALSDYLSSNHKDEFKIYWSFKDKFPDSLDPNVIPLKWGSLKYILTTLSCKFLISNTRNAIETMLFYKREQQVYIMTWHAGMGLKRVEKDSELTLDKHYIRRCLYDSHICDLMIAGSKFQADLFKNSFWYDGEILKCGTPRNDVLFSHNKDFRKLLCKSYDIDKNSIIVLYAPTFRSKFNPLVILFDWVKVRQAIEKKYDRNAILLVRLHPNIRDKVNQLNFKFDKECIDVTSYPDMQELLVASDMLITDYSSSMFDFSLMKKPCFLLVKDRNEYDRGFYVPLATLPFDLAESDEDLVNTILSFDESTYIEKINDFNNKKVGSFEKGVASDAIYNWIRHYNQRQSNCLLISLPWYRP